jgi:hypothetical protein
LVEIIAKTKEAGRRLGQYLREEMELPKRGDWAQSPDKPTHKFSASRAIKSAVLFGMTV